ncbi:MAG: phospholipase D-like domain-containing protein [Polyangia bacterium]|jgi:cardiolipin synthase
MEPDSSQRLLHRAPALPHAASSDPDRAIRRAGDCPQIPGNTVSLLRDGPAVFASWLADIAQAKHFILLENYIFRSDRIGHQIADALAARAKAGIEVYVLFDWLGSLGTSRTLWVKLQRAGAKVRPFRSLRLTDPLRLLQRNHRKVLCIDGQIGHVGGLCIGDAWAGHPERGLAPWRDTAIRFAGPAAAELCLAFAETWQEAGTALPERIQGPEEAMESPPEPACVTEPQEDTPCAQAPLRVVSGLPGRSRIYRLTQVLLANAAERIWITDAYFLTPPTMYEALTAAARDGVDVRVLVPGRSDLPWISWLSRAGYLGLLEAGVRIFEWQGPMLHAKTTVVDGKWCRVGSSNLNLASLLTNWELDVVVEHESFGRAAEQMFLRDLKNSRELHLRSRRTRMGKHTAAISVERASDATVVTETKPVLVGGRAGAVVVRASAAVIGVALRRRYERSAWSVSIVAALLLLSLGAVGFVAPQILGLGIAGLSVWFGLGSLLRGISDWRHHSRKPRRSRRESRAE